MLSLDTLELLMNQIQSFSESERIHVRVDMLQTHHIQSSDKMDMKDCCDQSVQ